VSRPPLRASADLARLANEGFDLDLVGGELVVRQVPFLDAEGRVRFGNLMMHLSLAGDETVAPRGHIAHFGPGTPCDGKGKRLEMLHPYSATERGGGLVSHHMVCTIPLQGSFVDHYAMVTTMVDQIEAPVRAIYPAVSARSPRSRTAAPGGVSPFRNIDTASARAGIGAFAERLSSLSIGIVGCGGTGGYLLDLISKTPVRRIHLWDDDVVEQHTPFRWPGVATASHVRKRPAKVDHLTAVYGSFHRGIVPHRERLDAHNVAVLRHMDFVFLAMDSGAARRPVVEFLDSAGKPYIDCGMGLHVTPMGLDGIVRVTTSTRERRGHVADRIPMSDGGEDDPYSTNIQVADLNCLNAALAVVRWKRHYGFYADSGREHFSAFMIDGNTLVNEDQAN
jgi:hypothetical protein